LRSHFSPDTAFAINMTEEFLTDSTQKDCTLLPATRPLEGLRSQLWLQDPTLTLGKIV
jgi:hypothetical protein